MGAIFGVYHRGKTGWWLPATNVTYTHSLSNLHVHVVKLRSVRWGESTYKIRKRISMRHSHSLSTPRLPQGGTRSSFFICLSLFCWLHRQDKRQCFFFFLHDRTVIKLHARYIIFVHLMLYTSCEILYLHTPYFISIANFMPMEFWGMFWLRSSKIPRSFAKPRRSSYGSSRKGTLTEGHQESYSHCIAFISIYDYS